MSTDTTFITNEYGNKLKDRMKKLLADSSAFDCLVGYFYLSGFYKLEDELENVNKIRILVGMGTDSKTFEAISKSHENIPNVDLKEAVNKNIIHEMDTSDDTIDVERGVRKFISWLKSGKLEIKAYKKRSIHSKLYIMTFNESDKDDGRVITGSSNLTAPGLDYNLEFNVELKDKADYKFALEKFKKLWDESVEITEEYVNTLENKTWLNDEITPYELYLKFLYEYLYEKINTDLEDFTNDYYHPDNFEELKYQIDEVTQAKNIIKEHNGVFLSDVVGTGKTYMGSMLLQQLKGRSIVIAPPALIDRNNPGGWFRVLNEFDISAETFSTGNLDEVERTRRLTSYDNVLIDESHTFRNEETQRYDKLKRICRGKNVILVSATPFNNKPEDLLSQIKLFQNAHHSSLPNPRVHDLEKYFSNLNRKLRMYDPKEEKEKYDEVSQEVTDDIRENILQYLMVRRTRNDIQKYYSEDLKKQGIEFPKVNPPHAVYYEFNEKLDKIFDESLEIISQQLTFAKYMPLSKEYNKDPKNSYQASQRNMSGFIKTLLIKRLESSVYAFKKSIDASVYNHEQVLKMFDEQDKFYTTKKYHKKLYELIETSDLETIDKLMDRNQTKASDLKEYKASEFTPQFREDMKHDLELFKHIQKLWADVEKYPKNMRLVELLNGELKNKKVIIFTEFIDTANFLDKKIKDNVTGKVLKFTGNSKKELHQKVIDNFDDNVIKEKQKNNYDILITTDVLSHGVNLHRSNIIINYDISWNPTRIMQRVGRVERLGTKFKEIHIYNFFPTAQIEDTINIQKTASDKISKFINLLGNDSQLLTEEPIQSYDLFNKLNNPEEEDSEELETELKYIREIRDIRDNNKDLYKKIENLPQKARVTITDNQTSLITLLRSNKFKKIIKTSQDHTTEELDFITAAHELKKHINDKPIPTNEEYYQYLNSNLNAFEKIVENANQLETTNPEKKVINILTYLLQDKDELTKFEKNYIIKLKKLIKQGSLTKNEINKINRETKQKKDIHEIFHEIYNILGKEIMNIHILEKSDDNEFTKVMLSEYTIRGR